MPCCKLLAASQELKSASEPEVKAFQCFGTRDSGMEVADAARRLIRVAGVPFIGYAVTGAPTPLTPKTRGGAPAAVDSAPRTPCAHPGAASASPPSVGVPSSTREGAPAAGASSPRTPSENLGEASAVPPAADVLS